MKGAIRKDPKGPERIVYSDRYIEKDNVEKDGVEKDNIKKNIDKDNVKRTARTGWHQTLKGVALKEMTEKNDVEKMKDT